MVGIFDENEKWKNSGFVEVDGWVESIYVTRTEKCCDQYFSFCFIFCFVFIFILFSAEIGLSFGYVQYNTGEVASDIFWNTGCL